MHHVPQKPVRLIDQLGNVLAGGNPDSTISARIGYYTHEEAGKPMHWEVFRKIVDFTFRPIDGPGHCHQAYHADAGEVFDNAKNWAIAILFLLILSSCILIAALLYPLWLFGIVSPRDINHTENIKKRVIGLNNKLKGVNHELEEHEVKPDMQLKLYTSMASEKMNVLEYAILHSGE